MTVVGGLGRTDLRFLLPDPVTRVVLLGAAADWADAYATAGMEVVTAPADADLVVADRAGLPAALAGDPRSVLIEGPAARDAVAAAGLRVTEYLPLPTPELPTAVVPLGGGRASAYVVSRAGGSPDLRRGARNRIAGAAAGLGRIPGERVRVTLGCRNALPPFPVAAAHDFGVPQDVRAALLPGASDLLSRCALVLFAPGARRPGWVIKLARVPQVVVPFERDALGLGLAERAGPMVAAHAPRLLGRFEAGGLQMSVESAAPGQSLVRVLESTVTPHRRKERHVEAIAAWLARMGQATARPAPALAGVADRLATGVLPAWGAPAGLADALRGLPAVLAHHDPGPWNIVVEGSSFTVLDWESARASAPPLWDLVYFLAHAALLLDGADLVGDPAAHVVRVFQGEAPSSPLVHRVLAQAAARLALAPEAVGPLLATCWLHHGRSHAARGDAVRDAGGQPASGLATMPARLAERWLATPGLGARWDARRW